MTKARRLSAAAPAKINLYLHVTARRDDGYHILDSLVAFAAIQDVITAEPAIDLSLVIDGPFADALPTDDSNLILKTARALQAATGVTAGARLTLTKRLPVASGIGGGSTDAAATLRLLCRLWDVHPADTVLHDLALSLGADVPVCLGGKAAFMGGIGDKLAPPPALPETWIVLVNPGVAVSTPEVFAARTGDFSSDGRFSYAPANAGELAGLLGARRNDLTDAAISICPVIADVLAALEAQPGCLLARLSGSGATGFGLFAKAEAATQAALALAVAHPDWWVRPASLETDINRLNQE